MLEDRPLVAVSMARGQAALEGGEVFELPGLVDRLREYAPGERGTAGRTEPLPPAIVLTDNALDLLGFLDQSTCAKSPFWQWQVSIRSTGAWRPEARSHGRQFLQATPRRFGYASRVGGHRRPTGRSRWYLMLDPHQFCELPGGWGALELTDLLRFGLELREWTNRVRLPLLQSVSSYGGRLLRDARFGEGWRRKVPAATNRRIRTLLPGNHYQLLTGRELTHPLAHKWDQQAAHHHAAYMSRFPHSDELRVAGRFRTPAPPAGAPFTVRGPIRAGSPEWFELTSRPGMFTIAVSVDERVALDNLELPQLRRAGRHWQTFTSVELEHVRATPGVRLLDLWCCWTSPQEDDRLRDYAAWASRELEAAEPTRRRWLKPLLLAAYGMLAVRPSKFRNGWRWCHRPDGAVGWQTPYGQLVGLERVGRREREPQTANVLWRAIIESRVRLESLRFARELRGAGARPIAIYADAVFATAAPEFDHFYAPAPWRYEGPIHELSFESPGRYRSREEVRLPGSPRARDGLQRAISQRR